jgi:RNAse (barnase) inhibitor barstar
MSMSNEWLTDAGKAGVFHLTADPRELAEAAATAGLAVYRLDIGHAHDKGDFLRDVSQAMKFPATFGNNLDAFADCMKDLSWADAPGNKGWVIILEKSKHFCAGHHHAFTEAMDTMAEAAAFWKTQGKPLWTLIGGPDGWISGWENMPSA